MDWLDLHSPWTFVIVGLVLVALEMLAPGFFLIWLGLAAIVVGLVNFAIALPWEANGILFALLSVALALLGKRDLASGRRRGDNDASQPARQGVDRSRRDPRPADRRRRG